MPTTLTDILRHLIYCVTYDNWVQGIIYVGCQWQKKTQDYCDDLHIIQRNQGMDFLIRYSVTSRKTVYTDDEIILLCQVFTAAYVP